MPLLAVYFVAASPGYHGVGAPAAIGQLESHAVYRAAFACCCCVAGSSGSGGLHVFSFAALGCLVVPGFRPVANAFLT